MRRILLVLVASIFISALTFSGFCKELKIGYVDVLMIFNEYHKTKEYDQLLEEKKVKQEKDLDAKKEEIEKMRSQLSLLKDDKQKKQQETVNAAIKGYQESEKQILLDLKKERDEKMKELIDDIDKVINGYAKEEGFDLILNGNAIIYGNKAMDITEVILLRINKN